MMRSSIFFLAFIPLLSACAPTRAPEPDVSALPEASTLRPASQAAQDHVAAARERIRSTSDAIRNGSVQIELYARARGTEHIVPVPDSTRWSLEMEVSYNLIRDLQGQVLAWIETPISQSGDWHNQVVHYFGSDGRTLAFRRSSSFFNGCPQPAREYSLTFLGPLADVIAREYTLSDFDGAPLDESQCEFLYRFPYPVYRSWSELAPALSTTLNS
jgi:hypothetical protein